MAEIDDLIAIMARLRDDYGLEISHLSETIAHQPVEEREAIDREIADLRRKMEQSAGRTPLN